MEIILEDQIDIGLGRRRDRAHVKDRLDRRRGVVEELDQILGRDDGGDVALGDVAPFIIRTEPVAHDEPRAF